MYMLLQNVPLAAMDFDSIIIGVIIIGSIIGKIMKARNADTKKQKGAAGQSGPPPVPSQQTANAQEELENFLRTLAGGNDPVIAATPKAPPPPPPPRPKPAAVKQTDPRPATTKHALSQDPKRRSHYKKTPAPSPPPMSKPVVRLEPQPTDAEHTCEATATLQNLEPRSAFSKSISNDIRENRSIRKAIVLREILGPPIALRRGA